MQQPLRQLRCQLSSVRYSHLASLAGSLAIFLLRTVHAFGGPVFRGCGFRFASCPPPSSRFAAFDGTVHAFGGPVFRGCGFRFASCPHPSSRFAAFDYYGLFHPTIGNSCLAALPLASLLCALDFRFACFAHCARRSSVPLAAPPLLPPYTGEPFKSHHTAWWVVPSLLGYVCIWAPCTSSPPVLRSIDPCCLLIIE